MSSRVRGTTSYSRRLLISRSEQNDATRNGQPVSDKGRRSTGNVLAAGLALLALALVAAHAAAASTAISLKLLDGRVGARGTSCGATPHWVYYRSGGIVRYTGRVTGAPVGAKVRIVVRRCYTAGFDVVETQTAHVKTGGTFIGSFPVHARSDCFVQASYLNRVSNRAYFRVR